MATGLKKHYPDITFSGNQVTPDELDRYEIYHVANPSVDPTWFGTATGTQTVTSALGVINQLADYPRNMVFAVAAAAGSARGGIITVNGKDQFGGTIQEIGTIAPATGGGTIAGTKVFSEFTSGSAAFGTGDAGPGTARIGVAIGTSTTLQHVFGLPNKVKSTADVKSIVWINNGTATGLANGTAVGTLVGTALHSFRGTAIVTITDRFVVRMKSSYDASNDLARNMSQ